MTRKTSKTGAAGTTDQMPRWEGPEETRPRGYLPAQDDPETAPDASERPLKKPDRRTPADAETASDNEG